MGTSLGAEVSRLATDSQGNSEEIVRIGTENKEKCDEIIHMVDILRDQFCASLKELGEKKKDEELYAVGDGGIGMEAVNSQEEKELKKIQEAWDKGELS